MNSFPFDIVGFDLDGTLLDTHRDLGDAVNHALGLANRPAVPVDQVRGLVGGGSRRMLGRALGLTGGAVPDDEFDELHRRLLDYYDDNIANHSCLFAGGEAMLDGLEARGIKLAIVTNKFERYAVKLLEALNLSRRFHVILGGDSLGQGKAKPTPHLLNEMVARAGGGRSVYIGDTTFDTGAARAAGIPCVVVSFGFNDLPAEQLGGDAVIDHYDDLIGTLEKL